MIVGVARADHLFNSLRNVVGIVLICSEIPVDDLHCLTANHRLAAHHVIESSIAKRLRVTAAQADVDIAGNPFAEFFRTAPLTTGYLNSEAVCQVLQLRGISTNAQAELDRIFLGEQCHCRDLIWEILDEVPAIDSLIF